MALVFFKLFPHPHLTPFQPEYWLMMQVAMIIGYGTATTVSELGKSGKFLGLLQCDTF